MRLTHFFPSNHNNSIFIIAIIGLLFGLTACQKKEAPNAQNDAIQVEAPNAQNDAIQVEAPNAQNDANQAKSEEPLSPEEAKIVLSPEEAKIVSKIAQLEKLFDTAEANNTHPLTCEIANNTPLFNNGTKVVIEYYETGCADTDAAENQKVNAIQPIDIGYPYLGEPRGDCEEEARELETESDCSISLKIANANGCMSLVTCKNELQGSFYLDKDMVAYWPMAYWSMKDIVSSDAFNTVMSSDGNQASEALLQFFRKITKEQLFNPAAPFLTERAIMFKEINWSNNEDTPGGETHGSTVKKSDVWIREEHGDCEFDETVRVIFDPKRGIFSNESGMGNNLSGLRIITK